MAVIGERAQRPGDRCALCELIPAGPDDLGCSCGRQAPRTAAGAVNLEKWEKKIAWREKRLNGENPHWHQAPQKIVWMLLIMKRGRMATPGQNQWELSFREWLLSLPSSERASLIEEVDMCEIRRGGCVALFSSLLTYDQPSLFR